MKECVAVVLSGGAAYGAYEVGVLKALAAGYSPATGFRPLEADVFAGTSAGAFNVAVLLSYLRGGMLKAASVLERVWLELVADTAESCGNGVLYFRASPFRWFNPDCIGSDLLWPLRSFLEDSAAIASDSLARGQNLLSSRVSRGQRALELVDLGVLTSSLPFVRLVHRVVRLEAIRDSPKQIRIPTTNWLTGTVHVFGNEHMTDAEGYNVIVASSSVPGIFPSVELLGQPHVDGGVAMNTPIRPAVEAGAHTIHVVYVDPDTRRIPLPKVRSTVSTLYRLMTISLAHNFNRDIEIAARINDGVEILTNPQRRVPYCAGATRNLTLTLGGLASRPHPEIPYRKLTIHRYHLNEEMGEVFRWLEFGQSHLESLVERGFRDTVEHDCRRNDCIGV